MKRKDHGNYEEAILAEKAIEEDTSPQLKTAKEIADHLILNFPSHERFEVYQKLREILSDQHRKEIESLSFEARSSCERFERLQKEVAY
jgi:hypothetical protein